MRIPPTRLALYLLCVIAVSVSGVLTRRDPAAGRLRPAPGRPPLATDQAMLQFSRDAEAALIAHRFGALEAQAASLRDLTARFVGGLPKLGTFYRALGAFQGSDCGCGEYVSDVPLAEKDRALKAWLAETPESMTANIAMTRFLIALAWNTRGADAAQDVNDGAMQRYQERMAQALQNLRRFDPRLDAEIYSDYLSTVDAMGGGRDDVLALYKAATATFPSFYSYYPKAANFLQVKWFGTAEDVPALFRALAARGDDTALVAYSFAAVGLAKNTDAVAVYRDSGVDWPTLKRSFAVRERLYGVDSRLMNMEFFMAAGARDHAYAADLAGRIGIVWDRDVWGRWGDFATASSWARLPERP